MIRKLVIKDISKNKEVKSKIIKEAQVRILNSRLLEINSKIKIKWDLKELTLNI